MRARAEAYAQALEAEQTALASVKWMQSQLETARQQWEKAASLKQKANGELQDATASYALAR